MMLDLRVGLVVGDRSTARSRARADRACVAYCLRSSQRRAAVAAVASSTRTICHGVSVRQDRGASSHGRCFAIAPAASSRSHCVPLRSDLEEPRARGLVALRVVAEDVDRSAARTPGSGSSRGRRRCAAGRRRSSDARGPSPRCGRWRSRRSCAPTDARRRGRSTSAVERRRRRRCGRGPSSRRRASACSDRS